MKRIVCHGDSLTEASDLDKNSTWPILVANRLNLNVIKSGIGGDTSGGLLGRFYHDVVRHQPDLVVILAGTNDLWWDLEVNLIQANIFAMACQAHSPVRTVSRLTVTRSGEYLYLDVQANAFLHHMVRNIAGVLMTVGRGEQPPEWVRDILEHRDRTRGGVTAPPQGLTLVGVEYPAEFGIPKAGV